MEQKYKVAFQDPTSKLFEINRLGSNEPQKLTKDEFEKLAALMPDVNWIVIQWAEYPQWHPGHPENLKQNFNGSHGS